MITEGQIVLFKFPQTDQEEKIIDQHLEAYRRNPDSVSPWEVS